MELELHVADVIDDRKMKVDAMRLKMDAMRLKMDEMRLQIRNIKNMPLIKRLGTIMLLGQLLP